MWLLKTEPGTYGYDDLEREGRAVWDGVTNPVALRNLRAMKAGDRVVVYHTGDQKAAVGLAEVVKEAYPDPKTGDPVDKVPGLVASRGFEVGARTEWIPGLQSSLALWKLDFNSELVYVGDAGATEANRPSTRRGVEWNNRWIPLRWLLVDADLAWTHARFSDDNVAGNRIPNAVDKVGSVAVTARDLGPWSASLQWRYLGSGALIEDNGVRSNASLTTNLRVSRKLWRDAELTLDVFNLFDREVNDIEYYYESQLAGESAPVADRHVHPAEPRTVRLTLKVGF